jgi:hypothetical protein
MLIDAEKRRRELSEIRERLQREYLETIRNVERNVKRDR